MKKFFALSAFCFLFSLANADEITKHPQDTIIKTIKTVITTDSITGQTRTTITETEKTMPTVSVPESSIQYGGSSYNFIFSWKNKKNKDLSPHWTGIGMGFMNYDDKNIPNGSPKISKSHNFTLNLFDYSKQISRSNWQIVSGIGTEWSRYHFDDNAALTKEDGVTYFKPAPEGMNYNDTKLIVYYVTFPLLLEYQVSDFHISGGAVGFLKYYSKSSVNYYVDGNKIKKGMGSDLNMRAVDLRFRVQIGIKDVGIYGYYAPFSMFDKGKAPDLKTYTFGVMIGL